MPTQKEKYIAFIEKNYVPIFFQDVYLDIVCDEPWDVVLYEEEDQIKAAYVFMLKHKMGIKYIVQPQLCPYTGPVFFNCKEPAKVYEHLKNNLPKHQLIIQDYFFDIPILQADKGVGQKKHSYVIYSDVNVDELWNKQSPSHRRIIRKAERELKYEEVDNFELFIEFVTTTFSKRKKDEINDPNLFRRLDKVLKPRGQRKIVKCTNENGRTVAMCYFMKDKKWTYNIASSVVIDYRHYGMNLIFWKEIEQTLAEGRSFDFEGSMVPGIERFFKRFQAQKVNYSSIYKASNKVVDVLAKLKISKGS